MLTWTKDIKEAAHQLNLVSEQDKNQLLLALADATEKNIDFILKENKKDLDAMDPKNPMFDRLKLTEQRIKDIASDIRKVSSLPTPLDKIIEQRTLPNGLSLTKKSVPFGVIGIIYEARPNVSFDVFTLCFKSGNVCVLKGGTDAHNSNVAIVSIIKNVLTEHHLNPNFVHLMPAGRESTAELLSAVGVVDLIIPRGSKGLINFVRENSHVPVIETGAGICHAYFDEFGDIEKGKAIINNAKTRRVSVCNALDCALIHSSRLNDLSELCSPLSKSHVVIEADERAYVALKGYPYLEKADDESFGTEFQDYRMAIKMVDSIEEAIAHINTYGSKHSESIITENEANAEKFTKQVDAACVYTNAPTSFTDGGQFGMGAEIGISTQKLHARGPMALPELTSYKWIIKGNGQTRP